MGLRQRFGIIPSLWATMMIKDSLLLGVPIVKKNKLIRVLGQNLTFLGDK